MNQTQLIILSLSFPLIMLCLTRIVTSIGDIVVAIFPQSDSRIVYVNVEKEKIVYRDQPVKEKTVKNNTTSKDLMEETVSALKSLGVPKAQGRKLVSTFCTNKNYTTTEDLLKDCLSSM